MHDQAAKTKEQAAVEEAIKRGASRDMYISSRNTLVADFILAIKPIIYEYMRAYLRMHTSN